MAFEISPESAAAWREQLPQRIVDLFLARTHDFAEALGTDTDADRFKSAVDQAVERLLGPLRGSLCHDPRDPVAFGRTHAEITMNHCPDHPDWVLLEGDRLRVEAAVTKAVTNVLGLAEHPIAAEAQALGYWGTEQDVLGVGVLRVVLRRTAPTDNPHSPYSAAAPDPVPSVNPSPTADQEMERRMAMYRDPQASADTELRSVMDVLAGAWLEARSTAAKPAAKPAAEPGN
jgi:hypothetical protein